MFGKREIAPVSERDLLQVEQQLIADLAKARQAGDTAKITEIRNRLNRLFS